MVGADAADRQHSRFDLATRANVLGVAPEFAGNATSRYALGWPDSGLQNEQTNRF